MEKKVLNIRGLGLWAIAFATVVLALALLFGATFSPWWILLPVAIPVVSVLFLVILALALILIIFGLTIVGLILAAVPLLAVLLCCSSLDIEAKEETKTTED